MAGAEAKKRAAVPGQRPLGVMLVRGLRDENCDPETPNLPAGLKPSGKKINCPEADAEIGR